MQDGAGFKTKGKLGLYAGGRVSARVLSGDTYIYIYICVCVCVCIYIYMHIYIHTYTIQVHRYAASFCKYPGVCNKMLNPDCEG